MSRLAPPGHPRFVAFFAIFLAGTAVSLWRAPLADAMVTGFDLGAVVFIASCIPLWRNDRLEAIRARAARDDGGRALLFLVAGVVLAAVLVSLGLIILGRDHLSGADFALVVATLVLAWLFSNLVTAFHYANLYHRDGDAARALDFPGDEDPLFADFCYFSLVIGMTCQVSDVAIRTRQMRRVATVHGIFAFYFNLGVLALIINVLAGLI